MNPKNSFRLLLVFASVLCASPWLSISRAQTPEVPAFLHRIVRKSHYIEVFHPCRSHIDLHLHVASINPVHRRADCLEEHLFQAGANSLRSIYQLATIRQRYR